MIGNIGITVMFYITLGLILNGLFSKFCYKISLCDTLFMISVVGLIIVGLVGWVYIGLAVPMLENQTIVKKLFLIKK